MRRRRRRKYRVTGKFIVILVLAIVALTLGILLLGSLFSGDDEQPGSNVVPGETPVQSEPPTDPAVENTPDGENPPVVDETPVPPVATPLPEFNPTAVEGTRPQDFGMKTDIEVNGSIVSSYQREQKIDFGVGSDYTDVEGIIGFRGNNFRDSASYGKANIVEKRLDVENAWQLKIGSVPKVNGSGSWTGSGWTGQPLIVRWPEETKAIMNMYPSAKAKAGLVEVIYATMDGNIYFLDAETGEKTRDNIKMGKFPFKGAGALDPRGYPLMYLGSGEDSADFGQKSSHAFIISLIDNKVIYEFGEKDGFSLRDLSYFDSSALVDAETDTLIYPGESGILYLIKLNTAYDKTAGTISISPETVKWRYQGSRTNSTATKDGSKGWWLGIEDSAIVWRGHIFFADNGGHLMCLNLNTLELVWVQDTLDDTNCTAVMELENGHPYLYISTSFHGGWRERTEGKASIPVWKIDAVNGQRVWTNTDYSCQTISGVSGGIQGSFAIGKGELKDYVFAPVAMTDGSRGKLVAFNKTDGTVAWECNFAGYPWSSPVVIYDQNDKGYIIQCNSTGYIHLIDGLTGAVIYEAPLGSNVEASPAVFENNIVVGTRGQIIYGIKIK